MPKRLSCLKSPSSSLANTSTATTAEHTKMNTKPAERLHLTSFQLTIDEGGVAILTINCPDSTVNLINTTVLGELEKVLDTLAKRKDIKGMVIHSGKSNGFIAGADIKEIVQAQKLGPDVAYQGSRRGKQVFAKLAALPFRTVAAIHGRCLGGGLELALHCTYRLASDDESTLIGLPEVALGVIPGWGGCIITARLAGLLNASKLVLSPLTPWSAHKAWRHGVVSEVVPVEHMLKRANFMARRGYASTYKPTVNERLLRAAVDSKVGRWLFRHVARLAVKRKTGGKYPAPLSAIDVLALSQDKRPDVAANLESATFAKLSATSQSREAVQTFLNRKSGGIQRQSAGKYQDEEASNH